MAKILLVEDDKSIVSNLTDFLIRRIRGTEFIRTERGAAIGGI